MIATPFYYDHIFMSFISKDFLVIPDEVVNGFYTLLEVIVGGREIEITEHIS